MNLYYTQNNKIKKAIALQYDHKKDAAPRVTAKGYGVLADKIIELADENNIKIKQNEDLVEILSILELNDHIPLEVYGVVAEIISNIYKAKR